MLYHYLLLSLLYVSVNSQFLDDSFYQYNSEFDINRLTSSPGNTISTTPYIDEVFLGKCYLKNPVGLNCTALAAAFKKGATAPNSLNVTNYLAMWSDFFEIASFSVPNNATSKPLLWSGNKNIAGSMSAHDGFIILEETPVGYIMDGLTWCGDGTGTNYEFEKPCAWSTTDTVTGMDIIWQKASQQFANSVAGDVSVVFVPRCNSTAQISGDPVDCEAFRNGTIFLNVEYPTIQNNVQSKKINVTSFTIYVFPAPDDLTENCDHPDSTLGALFQKIQNDFNIDVQCISDAKAIADLLCQPIVQIPSGACLAASLAYGGYTPNPSPSPTSTPSPSPTPSPTQAPHCPTIVYTKRNVIIMALAGTVVIVAVTMAIVSVLYRRRQGYQSI